MRKSDDRKSGPNIIATAVMGGATGFMCAMIILLIVAVLTSMGKIPEKFMRETTVLACGLGQLIGSFAAARRQGGRTLITGVGSGISMFLITMVIAAFTDKGVLSGALTSAILIAIMAGGIFGSLLCAAPGSRRR